MTSNKKLESPPDDCQFFGHGENHSQTFGHTIPIGGIPRFAVRLQNSYGSIYQPVQLIGNRTRKYVRTGTDGEWSQIGDAGIVEEIVRGKKGRVLR